MSSYPQVIQPRLDDEGAQYAFERAYLNPKYCAAQPYLLLHSEHVVFGEVVRCIQAGFKDFGFNPTSAHGKLLDMYIIELLRGHCESPTAQPQATLFAIYLNHTGHTEMSEEEEGWLIDMNEYIQEMLSHTRVFGIHDECYRPTGYEYIEVVRKDGFVGFACLGDIRILRHEGVVK